MSCLSLCVTLHLNVKWKNNIEVHLYGCLYACSVWRGCAKGISINKRLCWRWGTLNGPHYRAELTGLAQPLWARLSLRLHGFMPPNTQMDRSGRREAKESVESNVENSKSERRRPAMWVWRINRKIKRKKKTQSQRHKPKKTLLDQSFTNTFCCRGQCFLFIVFIRFIASQSNRQRSKCQK